MEALSQVKSRRLPVNRSHKNHSHNHNTNQTPDMKKRIQSRCSSVVQKLVTRCLATPLCWELCVLFIIFFYCLRLSWTLYLSRRYEEAMLLERSWSEQLRLYEYNADIVSIPFKGDYTGLHGRSVIFGGLLRNAERTLQGLLHQLDLLSCAFDQTQFLILESNSNDGTPHIIRKWSLSPTNCNQFSKYFNKKGPKSPLINKTIFQPEQEFSEIIELMRIRKTTNVFDIREERYVIYRNFLLKHALKIYESSLSSKTKKSFEYLIWLDMDLKAFDVVGMAQTFPLAWKAGFDVVCADSVKYSGWYYDSYATVFEDGEWGWGQSGSVLANKIRTEEYMEVRSCFGGFASYNLKLLFNSHCRYESFYWAYSKFPEFAEFVDRYSLEKSCEHLPLNFCLRYAGGKLAIATRAFTFYGVYKDAHGENAHHLRQLGKHRDHDGWFG